MYIIKNAWTNIKRNKGRNILIGLVIIIVTISSYISLAINTSSNNLVESYKNSNPLEVTLSVDMRSLRENRNSDSSIQVEALTVDQIISYGDSEYVKDYYYYYTTSLASDSLTAISMDDYFKKPEGEENNIDENAPKMDDNKQGKEMNDGDFKFTAYSDVAYIEAFVDGSNKITDGKMFDNNETGNVIVISSDLADENSLSVGDKVTFYSTEDSSVTIEFEIIGIYEDSSDNSDNFMNMNAMISSNQIYTTKTAMESILELKSSTTNSLNAKFYLNNSDDLENYSSELREKGLSEYYTINDNTDTILSTLKPIQNISSFSITFLIIVCLVALIVIGILTMINIRDRKYEIGVLRAIGMSKIKVMSQLIIEIITVTIIAIVIGMGIGKVLSQPVTNAMLANEIEKYQEEQNEIETNFGGPGFDRGGFTKEKNNNQQAENYVDTLTVEIDPITIIKVAVISLLITIISGMISITYVNRYSPNKILQNRG